MNNSEAICWEIIGINNSQVICWAIVWIFIKVHKVTAAVRRNIFIGCFLRIKIWYIQFLIGYPIAILWHPSSMINVFSPIFLQLFPPFLTSLRISISCVFHLWLTGRYPSSSILQYWVVGPGLLDYLSWKKHEIFERSHKQFEQQKQDKIKFSNKRSWIDILNYQKQYVMSIKCAQMCYFNQEPSFGG